MEQLEVKEGRVGVKDVVQRRVGVFGVVGMFYAICCAGAFGIEEMIPDVGPGVTVLLLIILPFCWALPYSLICAEMGSARPVEGGNMIWVKEALGEFWFGIMVFVNFLWGLVANTVYVVLAVDYLGNIIDFPREADGTFTPESMYIIYAIKVGLIALFFIINVLGIKEVSTVSTVLSVAVLIVFALVTVYGFANAGGGNPLEPFMSDEYDGNLFMTLGAGLGIGIWMYSGFDEISLFAGEIRDSHRIIPKALMIVIPLMIATYVLPTLAGLASVGQWDSWSTESGGVGYYTVLEQFAPPALGVLFIVVAIIGQCSIYNMCVAVAGRATLILSDENFGPKALAKLTKKKGMPWVSLLIVAAVTTLFLGTPTRPLDFVFLVLVDVFFMVIVCALTVIAAMVLKRRLGEDEFKFKIPGGLPMHNFLVVLCLIFCLATILLNGTDYFFGGFIIMLLIPVLYVVSKWIWKGPAASEPDIYPIDRRTGLGFGDLKKIGAYFMGFGVLGVASKFFLSFYEGDWGPGYEVLPEEMGEYEEGVIADYPDLSQALTEQNGLTDGSVWIPGYYEMEYEEGFFASFDGMLQAIMYVGIGAAIVGVVIYLFGRRLDKTQAMTKVA
ncbi:MAG: APC family permease [Clostridiales Family XIII bacterium]|jgi:amino acid transporter|nr:APC family permease [Clostridiales Family XIII bacterium]